MKIFQVYLRFPNHYINIPDKKQHILFQRDSGYDYNDSRSQSYRQFRDPDDYIDGFRGGYRDDFRDGFRDGFRVAIRDRLRDPLPVPRRLSVISIPIIQRPVRIYV